MGTKSDVRYICFQAEPHCQTDCVLPSQSRWNTFYVITVVSHLEIPLRGFRGMRALCLYYIVQWRFVESWSCISFKTVCVIVNVKN